MAYQRAMRLRILLVAAIAVTTGGCGGAAVRYAVHMQRAEQYLTARNLDKASIEVRNAMQVQPRAAAALDLNGRIEEMRGNWREAAGSYQAALDTQPGDLKAQVGLGKIYVMAGAGERALHVVAPGLVAHPDDPDLLAVRGAAEHLLKNEDAARADAERAVQLAPADETAIALLAALDQQTGKTDQAVALVAAAVRKAPATVSLREVLATLYLSTGQKDLAEQQLRQLVELRPEELPPRVRLAQFLSASGRLEAAQRVLEEAVQKLPKSAVAKVTLADFIATQRSRAAGEATLRKFIGQDPGDYDLRFALGALLQRSGATDEAIAVYREIVSSDGTGPRGLNARTAIAALELTRGQFPPAEALVAEVLRKNPRDSDALILRANISLARNDPTPAIADLRAVLRDQPQSASLHRTLARAYLAQGNSALAEEALHSATEAAPNDPAVVIEFAQFLAERGRVAEAATALEAAVRRMPDNAQVREALIRAYLGKHDMAAARAAAEDLKALHADAPDGFYFAGLVAQQENRLEDSEKDLQRALALKPDSIDVLAALSRLDVQRGKGAAAIARLKALAEHQPRNVLLLNLLGQTYLATKDTTDAASALTQAIEADPRSWPSYRNRARVKVVQSDADGAIADYEAALKIAPSDPQLLMEAAALEEQHGKIDAAIAGYDALYRNDPQVRQLAANNLAMLLVTYRKDQASLDRARELSADFASSDNGALLDTNGWVRFKRGEYTAALSVLEQAVTRSPDSKVIRFHRAMAELQLGLRDRARSDLETALSGSGSFLGSDEARATLTSLTQRSS
jgi:predicted Zn-dependent protease